MFEAGVQAGLLLSSVELLISGCCVVQALLTGLRGIDLVAVLYKATALCITGFISVVFVHICACFALVYV